MIGDATDYANEWDVTHWYDRSAERPSEVVVRAVAGITNRNVCSIEPLYAAIEPDALDAFIEGEDERSTARVVFFYEGCRVYVDKESIAVCQVDEDPGE